MTRSFRTEDEAPEPVTVTDKRRIDPVTGEVRGGPAGSPPAGSPPAGSDPKGPAPVEAVAESAEEADRAAELLNDLQRVQADFANYRKRALRDQGVIAERGKAAVMIALLPILDDIDRARTHGDLESGPFKAVADKLVDTLDGLGLSGFGAEGDEFDPLLHEAVQHEGEGGHPVIGTVMRRGYRVGELVIRHAMVGVVDTDPDGDTPGNDGAAGEQVAESNDNE